jgi:subtilisin-like proprotein convertase family protein
MRTCRIIILLLLLGAALPPLLHAQFTESYTFTTNRLVPDGDAAGISDVQGVSSGLRTITSLNVRLKIIGDFNGDLYAYLRHANGFTVLLNRPGKTTNNPDGYADSGCEVTFQDAAANGDVHLYQAVLTPNPGSPLTGFWQPDGRTNDPALVTDASPRVTALANFNGLDPGGGWTLFVADLKSGGTNLLAQWGLDITGLAAPTLTWTNPADLTFGSPLSGTQLNATATCNATNMPGTFTYTPAAGTLLNAGANQMLTVIFTPTDTTDFLAVTSTVTINVQPAPVDLSLTASANPILHGQPVSFTATLTTTGATPDGSVTFYDGLNWLGTTNLAGGQATWSTATLNAGSHVIAVAYPGDANFLGATNTLIQWVTNPPPLAAAMTVTRTAGLARLIAWADVATNWSDAAGYSVSLTGLNRVTTNGVTLATNSAWILYPNAPNVNDQFSYSISDGHGSTNVGYVNLVLRPSVTGTNSITRINPGNPTVLTALGIPGYSYITERATNLIPPLWVDIATNLAATNGVITVSDYFRDLGSNPPAASFYQLKWQP